MTIFDSTDLSFAIQCSRVLKLQVLLNSELKLEVESLSFTDVAKLKSQIKTIRDQVNRLLDFFDNFKTVKPTVQGIFLVLTVQCYRTEIVIVDNESAVESNQSSNALSKINSSEFDPLQEKHQKNGTEEHKESKPPTPQVSHRLHRAVKISSVKFR